MRGVQPMPVPAFRPAADHGAHQIFKERQFLAGRLVTWGNPLLPQSNKHPSITVVEIRASSLGTSRDFLIDSKSGWDVTGRRYRDAGLRPLNFFLLVLAEILVLKIEDGV